MDPDRDQIICSKSIWMLTVKIFGSPLLKLVAECRLLWKFWTRDAHLDAWKLIEIWLSWTCCENYRVAYCGCRIDLECDERWLFDLDLCTGWIGLSLQISAAMFRIWTEQLCNIEWSGTEWLYLMHLLSLQVLCVLYSVRLVNERN